MSFSRRFSSNWTGLIFPVCSCLSLWFPATTLLNRAVSTRPTSRQTRSPQWLVLLTAAQGLIGLYCGVVDVLLDSLLVQAEITLRNALSSQGAIQNAALLKPLDRQNPWTSDGISPNLL